MIDDPNIVLPLAVSYNERGVAGYTHVVTNSEDQRKLNCMYEVARNPMTGKGTLTLSKRYGLSLANSTFGNISQNVYLIIHPIGTVLPWIISKVGNDLKANAESDSTFTLYSSGIDFPIYTDKTLIGNLASLEEQIVVQFRPSNPAPGNKHRVFYTPSSSISSWKEISDGDFTSISHIGKMEFLDGFAFIMSYSNVIWNSDVNSLASWSVTSFITKQITQDKPAGLARYKNQILAFGEDWVEHFYNAGNTTGSPLGRIPYSHQKIGMVPSTQIGGGHYYCTIKDSLFFVGREGGQNSISAFAYNGNYEKISNSYIDKILSEIGPSTSNSNLLFSVNSVGFRGQQAMAILLTSPNATSQKWLMFFPEWKEWFEWTSDVFSPINDGTFYLGCAVNKKDTIYIQSSADNWADDDTNYQFLTQFRLPTNGSSFKRMSMYGVQADTDRGGGAPVTNLVSVDVSDNDCQSFYSLQPLDLTIDRKVNFRGGSYTQRHVRLSATDDRPKRLHNFIATVID